MYRRQEPSNGRSKDNMMCTVGSCSTGGVSLEGCGQDVERQERVSLPLKEQSDTNTATAISQDPKPTASVPDLSSTLDDVEGELQQLHMEDQRTLLYHRLLKERKKRRRVDPDKLVAFGMGSGRIKRVEEFVQ